MNHLTRGGKNVRVARGALWLNLHSLPHFPQDDWTDGDYRHNSFPLPFPRSHPLPFLSCHALLTWSASEVDSMLISSRSAVSLHICSHFIFRNLSRSSKITPEGTRGRDKESPWWHVPAKAHPAHGLIQQLKQDMKFLDTHDHNPWNFSEERIINADYNLDLERACH